jgi:hypothetical protein
MYSQTLYAGWAHMDFNSHMAGTAYLNKCVDARLMLFAKHGFPASELARLKIGPVAMRDELEYFREVGLLQGIIVTNALAGLSGDGSRWGAAAGNTPHRWQALRPHYERWRLSGSHGPQTRCSARGCAGRVQGTGSYRGLCGLAIEHQADG